MEIIEIRTLVDITKTRALRSTQGSQLEQNQYRNFMTLCQCIEIRSIMEYDNPPEPEKIDITNMGFGTEYKGTHKVWTFRFRPDRVGVYANEESKVGCLLDDLDKVPIIKNLEESVNIEKAMFNCKDNILKNIIVKAL